MKARVIVVAVLALAGCANDTDPRWQLRHDRIVAIRSTPSHVPAGATAVLDGLVTSVDAGLAVEPPTTVAVGAGIPASFASVVSADGHGGWQLTAPDAATLDAARAALGLAADAPVPLPLTLSFAVGGEQLDATKQAWLGDARDNPTVGPVTIDGAAAPAPGTDPEATGAPITAPFDTDVALAIDADPSQRVNWLTSCGSLNSDDNEHAVLLHVKRDDATAGQLAVVVRDAGDGVAWQSWSIASTPP